jgi:hypothetical protein
MEYIINKLYIILHLQSISIEEGFLKSLKGPNCIVATRLKNTEFDSYYLKLLDVYSNSNQLKNKIQLPLAKILSKNYVRGYKTDQTRFLKSH